MSTPQPPVPLEYPCTTIYNNKLFAYQSNAFQCLDLKDGGHWSQLPMGVSTNGSTCVQGTFDGKPAFIVIGGSSSTPEYRGMQHYDLTSSQWTTDNPTDGVAVNRKGHGVAFLEQSSAVLVYAGTQDNDIMLSSQTFIIHTTSPYTVEAFESSAPPVAYPLMLSYNTSHALMLGGSTTNKDLSLFNPQSGWSNMGITLQEGLKGSSETQAATWSGADGGELLEIFDMSVTPNQISTLLLQNATESGHAQRRTRSYVSTPHLSNKRQKRDTTLAERPAYNSTLAPQETRSGFSLSSDQKSGLVVATGGSTQSPLAIFNQTSNQWIDPDNLLGVQPTPTTAQSTPSISPSATTSIAPSATSAAPAANKHVRDKSLTILGGVLGGVLGAAVLLVIILLLLRLYRRRRDRMREQRKAEYSMDDKRDPMDLSDLNMTLMKETGPSTLGTPEPTHQRNKSVRSERSLDPKTIDRGLTASSESKRALLHAKGDSAGSGNSFWSRGKRSPERLAPQISAPILGPPFAKPFLSPESPRVEQQREETGWSRYFANNNSREMLSTFPQPQQTRVVNPPRPETYLSNSQTQSDYGSSQIASSHPQSAEVEPLNFRGSHPLAPSNAGIPPSNASRAGVGLGLGLAITHGPSPDRDRHDEPETPSTVSNVSGSHEFHDYSHESEGHDSWSPVPASNERNSNWTDDRPISSVHSSRLYAHPGERVVIPNFPMPNSARNSTAPSPKVGSPRNERADPLRGPMATPGLRNVISKDLVRTRSGRLQATSDIRTGTQRVIPNNNAQSGPTSFLDTGLATRNPPPSSAYPLEPQDQPFRSFPRPREQPQAQQPQLRQPPAQRRRGDSDTEDMSWLNLGTSAEQHGPSVRDVDLYFPGR